MKRFIAILLVAQVALPWPAVPAATGAACSMPRAAKAPAACAYCTPAPAPASASAAPTLQAGCCRFLPRPESVPAQAGALGATPKPVQSPDLASPLPPTASEISTVPVAAATRFIDVHGGSPPDASPTRTTHLLL